MECTAGADDAGRRFDRVCRKLLPGTGLGEIYAGIRKGRITVNGRKKQPKYKLLEGDRILIAPGICTTPGETSGTNHGDSTEPLPVPELKHTIILENGFYIVFNKPPGILTHGKYSIQTFLQQYLNTEMQQSLAFSPAPLHRLDRNTSGIIVCSKSIEGAREFSKNLADKNIVKAYLGIHDGVLHSPELWKDKLKRNKKRKITYADPAGRLSILHIFPLIISKSHSFCLTIPVTGRTHQIRVQSALHGLPLDGDPKYNKSARKKDKYCLHAAYLKMSDEVDSRRLPPLFAPLPKQFLDTLGQKFTGDDASSLVHRIENEIEEKITFISAGK